MKYIPVLLLAVLFMACNGKKAAGPDEPRDGGPCTYTYDTLPAKVIKLNRQNNQPTQVMFAILHQQGTDTTSYFMANKRDISEEEIKQKGVAEGVVFRYIDGRMLSGACNPHVFHISLDKYEGKLPAARDTARF